MSDINLGEFHCIHEWPVLADFSIKPCNKCGAIREHIQKLDDLEDAVIAQHCGHGLAINEARDNRIASRAAILSLMRNEDEGPEWACCGCGNTDPGQYRTVWIDTPDGRDCDMVCDECGSREFEESPTLALRRVAIELDTVRAELECLKESIKNELR